LAGPLAAELGLRRLAEDEIKGIGPVLRVDTSGAVDIPDLGRRIRASAGGQRVEPTQAAHASRTAKRAANATRALSGMDGPPASAYDCSNAA
jgi:hypothetical protein